MRGDELWFYYTGIKYRQSPPDADMDTGAICLAVLRRDGFVSLDAGEPGGMLVTKPFSLLGSKLRVNVDALSGKLSAEVLDDRGAVLAASNALTGDLPSGEIDWQQGQFADLKGRIVSLRFTLSHARFYSYWIEE